ncbi:MAG: hypothetical protein K9N55_02780 [Phycisphaerae bacterium]|nr:hypothetical protein [Phycisphaerae bacterium]
MMLLIQHHHCQAFLLLLLTMLPCAQAFEWWSGEDGKKGDLDVAAKWTSLPSRAPDDPALYPDRSTLTELMRLRLDLKVQHSETLQSQAAYEQGFRWMSHAPAAGSQPTDVPFRISQMNWPVTRATDRQRHEHEIDRLLMNYHPDWGDVTVGRQAVGLGRGVVFSAMDLFIPFSPLDIDREWRRGVDAVRVERRLTDQSSAELLSVWGETWEQSAMLGRVRGYVGDLDAEFLFGKRAQDDILGTSLSSILGGAEVHGEVTAFHTPEPQPEGGFLGQSHTAVQAVVGSSYTFNWGNGLTVLGEYLYNGLGVKQIERSQIPLTDPVFRSRVARGDMQIVSQQALALQASYPLDLTVHGACLILLSPTDHSGVVTPSMVFDIGQTGRLITSAYVPWGPESKAGQLRSEYGNTPLSAFIQLAWYH